MVRRSSIGLRPAIKNFSRFLKYPWIGSKLTKIELEKRFFNLLHPGNGDGRAGKIRQASFRLTDICNLRCHTCGQWGDSGFLHGKDLKELKGNEVPHSRYLEIFSDLVSRGHRPLIYFWGGEPMLYDGIMDLIACSTAMGLPASIATNGTRVASRAEALVKAPLFLLQISIDGPTAEMHNQCRPAVGGGDNFKDILAALQAVQEERRRQRRNLPLITSLTVVSKDNFRHLTDLYQAFRDKVDLFVFYLSWWIDPENARTHQEDFNRRFGFPPSRHWGWIGEWVPDDFQALNHQLSSLLTLSRPMQAPPVVVMPQVLGVKNLEAYYTDHSQRFGFNQCVSIYQVVEVNSNGDVSPCRDYHDYVVGNIRWSRLTDLWNSTAYRNFRQSLAREGLMPVCSRCCGLMGY